LRPLRGEHLGGRRSALGLDKHRELVRWNILIFVDSRFHMPALKIAAIRAGECAGAESADRRTLPETVINVSKLRFAAARIRWRLPDRDAPCDGRYSIVGQRHL
jgi:hypothetical protein